jgi:hypothetical protein
VDTTAVDTTAVDTTAVDTTAVDTTAVDTTVVDTVKRLITEMEFLTGINGVQVGYVQSLLDRTKNPTALISILKENVVKKQKQYYDLYGDLNYPVNWLNEFERLVGV